MASDGQAAVADAADGSPQAEPGERLGSVRLRTFAIAVFQTGVHVAERQLASLDLQEDVLPDRLPYVRVNFTMAQ